jgi:HlyD family secretion protein
MKNVLLTIKTWLAKSIKLILVIAVIAAIVYKIKFAPTPVIGQPVTQERIIDEVLGSGALDAKVKMTVSPRISGRLDKVLVDQGDLVKKDQLLATLDDNILKQNVQVAEASLATAKSSKEKVQRDLEIEEAILANAVKTYNRQKDLIATGATSQSLYDKAAESLKTSQARYSRAKTAVIEAQDKINEATQILTLRKEQLEDAQIRTPSNGKIISRERDPGNIVVPGTSILTMVSTDVLWIRAWVDETALNKIKVGQPARIIFRSDPKNEYPGKVARIGSEVDRESREYIVDVFVDKLPTNWAIGQRAEVFIKAGEKEKTLTIPETMIQWRDRAPGVFVKKADKAIWSPVEIGLQGGGKVEILKGVSADDILVRPLNPKTTLTPNTRIKIPPFKK